MNSYTKLQSPLEKMRRSKVVAYTQLVTMVLSITAPLVPRAAMAGTPVVPSNPGNSGSSVGAANSGLVEGQTDLGVPETGPAAAGHIDPMTGAFSASVPFVMPSARGAVQPHLALVYTSAGAPGIGGMGWELNVSGYAIERRNLSGAPQYKNDPAFGQPINTDPTKGGVQDRFTFGGRPLVPICFVGGAGSCNPLNTRVPEQQPAWATGGWHYYRLEVEDGSNLRFYWAPNHQTWVIQDPSGATMELGVPLSNSGDSTGIDYLPDENAWCRIDADCSPGWTCTGSQNTTCVRSNPSGYDQIFRWNLVRQYDPQRIAGSHNPTNLIQYVWTKSNPTTNGIPASFPIGLLTDEYDTPKVGDASPSTASFAHHTHFGYAPLGFNNNTSAERARPALRLFNVDVTSQTYLGSGQREQIRRYFLNYATVGHQLELQSVRTDGWCSAGAPTEDPSTQLLPSKKVSDPPACGAGPSGNAWPPITTFTYSNANPTPTYSLIPQTFYASAPTPPTILDVNSDGMPDILDALPNTLNETVWLNSASSAALNTWSSSPITMSNPTLSADAESMNVFSFGNNYTSSNILNDAHTNGIWFDPNWPGSNLFSSPNAGVQYAIYSPRWGGSAWDWGTPVTGAALGVEPQKLNNCASLQFTCTGPGAGTYPTTQCAYPWMYLATDKPYVYADIDGDGIQDLVLSSAYGTGYANDSDNDINGQKIQTGQSNYYTLLNVKFSTRDPNGNTSPFAQPAPQETGSISGGTLHAYDCPNAAKKAWYVNKLDLPNLCVGPRSRGQCTAYDQSGAGKPRDCGAVVPDTNPDQTLGDINGDGIIDWINLYSDHFDVSFGHGDGVFGVCNDGSINCLCDEAHPITFSTVENGGWTTGWSPYNTTDKTLNVQFHDVDGDGFDDAIVPTPDGFDVYFIMTNSGPDVSPLHVPAGPNLGWGSVNTPGQPNLNSSYVFADMDGSGVDDVVIVSARRGVGLTNDTPIGYVNVLGGQRPGLLTSITVAGRTETDIQYKNLPQLSRETFATAPWATQSPQPITVAWDVSTKDLTPGLQQKPIELSYAFRDPIYDGRDKQFVGFTSVDEQRLGDASEPTMHTKTTYYQGHCDNTTYQCPQTPDYVYRAMRALPILTEIYGTPTFQNKDQVQGAALSTTHRGFNVRPIYSALDGRAVYRTEQKTEDTFWYDNSSGPVTRSLAKSLPDIYMNGAAYGTPTPFKTNVTAPHTHREFSYDTLGMSPTEFDYGSVDTSGNSLDGIVRSAIGAYLVPLDTWDYWIWRTNVTVQEGVDNNFAPLPLPMGIARGYSFAYDARGNLQTVQSQLVGTQPMMRSTPNAPTTPPPGTTPEGTNVTLSKYTVDPTTGNVTRIEHQSVSACQDIAYDPSYSQLPTATIAYTSGCNSSGKLAQLYNNYVRGLDRVTDYSLADGQDTRIQYEAYGRVSAIYRPDASMPGATESAAGISIDYGDTVTPAIVHTVVSAGVEVHDSYSVLNGFGDVVLSAVPGNMNEGDQKHWIVSDQNVRNGKGRVIAAYPPTFYDDWTQAPLDPSGGTGVFAGARTVQYDPFGRTLVTTDVDGTRTSSRAYVALGVTTQDAEQVLPSGAHAGNRSATIFDGHGRIVIQARSGNGGTVSERYAHLPTGEVWSIARTGTDSSGQPAKHYQRWMQYDSFGRIVLNAEPSSTANFVVMNTPAAPPPNLKAWTYAYNDIGQLIATTDARGCGKNIAYDAAGREVSEDYFGCTADHVPYSAPDPTTGNGAEVFYQYGPTGNLSDAYTRAAHDHYAYDARSRMTTHDRNVAIPGLVPTPTSGYATHTFEQKFAYDDLNRVTGQTTGEEDTVPNLLGGSVPLGSETSESAVTLHYSQRGELRSVDGSYGSLIRQVAYDADGLPRAVSWGDIASPPTTGQAVPEWGTIQGTQTTFSYDGRRRLSEKRTARQAPSLWASASGSYTAPGPQVSAQLLLEDTTFTRDAVGNPLTITDGRSSSEWPSYAGPVNRGLTATPIGYDDFYRVVAVTYSYSSGATYEAPTPSGSNNESVLPVQTQTSRIGMETFDFDTLGNIRGNTDDATDFFDRSIGMTTIGSVTDPSSGTAFATNQVISSSLPQKSTTGSVSSTYDVAGNLVQLDVKRGAYGYPAGCSSTAGCDQLFRYDWDEVGQLARARRYDFIGGDHCNGLFCTLNDEPTRYSYPSLPSFNAAADIANIYDGLGQRVIRSSTTIQNLIPDTVVPLSVGPFSAGGINPSPGPGPEDPLPGPVPTPVSVYTVDVFPTLRMNDTTFGNLSAGDYDRSDQTDQVTLAAGSYRIGRVVYVPGDPMTSTHSVSGQHVFFEIPDTLGSTATVIDQATSEVVERTTYTTFGSVESDYSPARWSSFREQFKFTDKEEDITLGITYFGARWYSPYLKSWISPDPLTIHGLQGDLNPYAYVHGQATVGTDPFGLDCSENQCNDGSVTPAPSPSLLAQAADAIGRWFSGIHIGGGGAPTPPSVPHNPAGANAATMANSHSPALGDERPGEEESPLPPPYTPEPPYHGPAGTWGADELGIPGKELVLFAAGNAVPRIAVGLLRGVPWLVDTSSVIVRSMSAAEDVRMASIVREISQGEKVADILNEVETLTRDSGLEHAVASLADGRRVIVSGGADGVNLSNLDLRRLLLHSHIPGSPPGASDEDFEVIDYYFQNSSWLMEVEDVGAATTRFRQPK